MNWFKKLFSKNDEDDYIEEVDRPLEQKAPWQADQKDVESRIAYQYPKGQFKFPLIPDDKAAERPRRRKQEAQEPIAKQEFIKETPPVRVERARSVTPVQVEKRRPEKVDYSKRPFRPTEIPSPVYGYQRKPEPPPKEEVVEFELESFLEPEPVPNVIELETEEEQVAFEEIQIAEEELAVTVEMEAELVVEEALDVIKQVVHSQDSRLSPTPVVEQAQEEEREPVQEFVQEKMVTELETDSEYENEPESAIIADPTPIPEQPKRKHLPFNVLMLKEDRRRIEEKKQPVRPAFPTSQVVPTVAEPAVRVEPTQKPINMAQPALTETAIAATNTETATTALETEAEITDTQTDEPYYVFPSLDLLTPPVVVDTNEEWLAVQERLLNDTLDSFNVRASVVNVTQGPSVTRFEVQPEPGVKVNKITNLSDDIKLSLAAKDIRIEAPIPGKHTIGIEVPNQVSRPVLISEIVNSPEFLHSRSPLTAVLGLDISGKPIVTDLRKMPHGLIAGATGSGKSVCINTILVSLLYRARPEELKLLLIDPKMVELAPYNHIPHLVSPVITDVKAATAALKWAVEEMERRYELFAHTGVREINRFNELCEEHGQYADKLPFIVIIIDELADLMMMAPADVEEAICRIAQKARACGIHLIIATQRPSVDVITGLIKANVPTRIAFSVSSQIDSRTIIDIAGAERLLGRGDMLFLENGSSKPVRLQGTFVSDEEIDQVVAHVRREQQPNYLFQQEELLKKAVIAEEEDELFFEACEFIVDQGSASTSSLQRRFKIGYNRAARLIDMMEKQGLISENRGSRPRDVLMDMDDLQNLQEI